MTDLARTLVAQGLLSEPDAEGIWSKAAGSGDSFVTQLLKGRRFKAIQIAEFAASAFGYPLFDLGAVDPESLPQGVLDPKLAQKRRMVALYKRGNKLVVGTSDPTNLQALDEIKFQTGLVIEPVVVEDDKLGKLLDKVAEAADNTMAVLLARSHGRQYLIPHDGFRAFGEIHVDRDMYAWVGNNVRKGTLLGYDLSEPGFQGLLFRPDYRNRVRRLERNIPLGEFDYLVLRRSRMDRYSVEPAEWKISFENAEYVILERLTSGASKPEGSPSQGEGS